MRGVFSTRGFHELRCDCFNPNWFAIGRQRYAELAEWGRRIGCQTFDRIEITPEFAVIFDEPRPLKLTLELPPSWLQFYFDDEVGL